MTTLDSKVQHKICFYTDETALFKHQLFQQAKRDYKYSKINTLLLHKNMGTILVLVFFFLIGYGKDQILFGILIKPYYYLFLALFLLHLIYQAWVDRKIKQYIQPEIDRAAYFSTTGTIKKIISHRPKDNLIEFEIEYLNPKSQIIIRVFKQFYQSDIYNPDDFNNRESTIHTLINQSVLLYLSADSETLIQLYLKNSAESSVHFKKRRSILVKNCWWYFHRGPLLSPVFLHPDDLRKIYLRYSAQDQHWQYTFQGDVFENITLHHQIINIRDFELELSHTLQAFDHSQYQAVKASLSEHPQLIWENKMPLSHTEKKALRKKLAFKFSLYVTVLSVVAYTILSSTVFKVIDDIFLNILIGLLSTTIIAFIFIYRFYALCHRRHYLATEEQVPLFLIQPRKKEHSNDDSITTTY